MSRDELNDIALPEQEDPELEKAIRRVRELYEEFQELEYIRRPLAAALYTTWKEMGEER